MDVEFTEQTNEAFPKCLELESIQKKYNWEPGSLYNLGCGNNKLKGFLNIDINSGCNPDKIIDFEIIPWDLPDNSADVILLYHVLEHLGETTKQFLSIIKELYRISRHNSTIWITVPYPLHSHFRHDPTHVRSVTPTTMSMFSQRNCDNYVQNNLPNTPLAHITGVDFEVLNWTYKWDNEAIRLYKNKGIIKENEPLEQYAHTLNNLAEELTMTIRVQKIVLH